MRGWRRAMRVEPRCGSDWLRRRKMATDLGDLERVLKRILAALERIDGSLGSLMRDATDLAVLKRVLEEIAHNTSP
jgi:hypothetical protein